MVNKADNNLRSSCECVHKGRRLFALVVMTARHRLRRTKLTAEADADLNCSDGLTGIDEFVRTSAAEMNTAERLESVGCRFEDLSGDGSPELLLMEILTGYSDASAVGSRLFAVYTLADGKPQCSLENLYRNSYELTADCPLKLTVPIYGTIPSYGISYTDTEGKEKISSINISGEDGSIQLTPIDTMS